ncbi:autotransporter outer membrane beta-barrel domain-containing protein [Pandoraea anapnoica]|uniref:Autotransporter outer membrane beta-barrel domain-containing protein n=1 Tax=Pandoraea anapnoica TaxID=2508301 RepID=A0A5E5AUY0_9BURK|nr:IPT/TIG domain-containing protein [Pandoraea anapnoica]VVE76123.1 autotransporter outer membrane beta-barrel domain-containing protein [Pandoraea anapnoica]
MSSSIRFRRGEPGARPDLSTLWLFWLKVLLALVASFGASFAAACTINWNATLAGQTVYTITSADPIVRACDPALDGLFSSAGGDTNAVVAADGSSLLVDLSGTGDYPLKFTPSTSITNTNTSWTFTMYQQSGDPVTINITRQLGVPQPSSVSPASGPIAGGNTVVITGTNFVQGTHVYFDATEATSVTVNDQHTITAVAPAHLAGAVSVGVSNNGGAASGSNLYTYVPPPTVTGVSPSQGSTAGGTSVTITGTNLADVTSVIFGGTSASITSKTATQIIATSPAGSAGTVDITVTSPGGTSAVSGADQFTYVNAPTVSNVSPSSGPTGGGTTVAISGSNFVAGSTSVKFGATAAAGVSVTSASSLTAVAPAGAAGTVDITVTTAAGTSATGASDWYTYVAPPTLSSASPSTGPTAGGTSVTLTGTNFTPGSTVTIGGTAASSVTFNSATSLTVTTPAHAAGGADIVVTTAGGAVTQTGWFTFISPPAVSSVSPTEGPVSGNTLVTISGTNFTAASQVTFGGTSASFVVVTATQITATAPPHSVGTVDIRVTTPGGTSATGPGDQYTYTAVPTLTSISPTSGSSSGGTSVTITGTGFTPSSTVKFGTTNATNISYNSSTMLTANAPAGSGIVDVTVSTSGGTSATNANDRFTYLAAPMVTGLSTNIGAAAGGTAVTITGTGFTGATGVRFGATSAAFTVVNDTSITTSSPAGSAGTVDVTVTGPGGTSTTGSADRFTFVAVPTAATLSLPNVPFNSGAVNVALDLSNHITSVAVGTGAAHGTVVVTGTTLTYTPTPGYSGSDSFTYTMTNVAGTSAPGTVTVTVLPSTFAYTPSAPVAGAVGVAYSTTSLASASGGSGTYIYAVASGALPTGLTLSPTGLLSGTPTAAGTFNFSVKATDAVTTTNPPVTSSSLTMTIGAPTITFSPGVLPDATAAVAYTQTVQATGGAAPYTYVLTGTLPTGLSFNPATGTISGTPTQTSVGSAVTVVATDANHFSGAIGYNVRVLGPNLNIVTSSLAAGTLGVPYTQGISVSGANAGFTVTATGLPNGLQLTQNGSAYAITGTPTAAGAFSVTIRLNDSTTGTGAPFSRTVTLPLNVNTGSITLTPSALPAPIAGQAYTQTFTASGGVAPYRYTVTSGALPAGLTLDPVSGVLSGTATSTGTSTFTVTVRDSSTGPGTPLNALQSYNVSITGQVASAPAVQTQTLSSAPVTFRATANAVGGPFTRIAIATPPASGTAVVNGEDIVYTPTPSTNGDVTFAYTLTNAIGTSAPIPVTVTVRAVPVTAAPQEMSVAANGTADFDITTSATGGPFTGANVVSISPANAGTATIISTSAAPVAAGVARAAVATGNAYTLRFVPAAAFAGVAVITYTVSNANATSAPGTAKVTVAPRKDPTTDPDVTGLIGAQVEAARRFATTQIGNYNQRLEMLHGKGRAPSSNGLNVVLPSADRGNSRDPARCQDVIGMTDRDACLRGEVSPTAMNKAKSLDVRDRSDKNAGTSGTSGVATGDGPDLPGEGENGDQRFAYWTAGTVDFGFANTAAQRSGFKFTTGGVTMGADYRFSDQFSLGAGVGYGHDSTDIGSSGTRSTGDSYSGALYASYRPIPVLFVDAVAGFGTLSFDSRRWVIDANDFARGKRNGQQFFGALSAGYEYRSDDWLFSPYGRLTASRSTLDQYSETGAGLNALTYFKQNVNTLSGTLGVRAGFAKATRIGTFSPYIRVELQHDFNGQSLAGLAYADIASSGPVYFVPGTPYGSDRVQVGAGTKLRTGTLIFGLDYSVTTGMGGLQQGFRLTFTAPF